MLRSSSTRELSCLLSESHKTNYKDGLCSISSILTCRFILNLRQVDHSKMPSKISLGEDLQFAGQGSQITLPRFIASFGEPLHTAPAGTEECNEVEDVVSGSGSIDDARVRSGADTLT